MIPVEVDCGREVTAVIGKPIGVDDPDVYSTVSHATSHIQFRLLLALPQQQLLLLLSLPLYY